MSPLLTDTLSLTIHLIVRYRELHANNPGASQYELVRDTIRAKALSGFYTAITTMLAVASLLPLLLVMFKPLGAGHQSVTE